jgi:hypothetical protein
MICLRCRAQLAVGASWRVVTPSVAQTRLPPEPQPCSLLAQLHDALCLGRQLAGCAAHLLQLCDRLLAARMRCCTSSVRRRDGSSRPFGLAQELQTERRPKPYPRMSCALALAPNRCVPSKSGPTDSPTVLRRPCSQRTAPERSGVDSPAARYWSATAPTLRCVDADAYSPLQKGLSQRIQSPPNAVTSLRSGPQVRLTPLDLPVLQLPGRGNSLSFAKVLPGAQIVKIRNACQQSSATRSDSRGGTLFVFCPIGTLATRSHKPIVARNGPHTFNMACSGGIFRAL